MYSQSTEITGESGSQQEDWLTQVDSLFAAHDNITSLLQHASQLVVELFEVEHCAITWMGEENATVEVRASFHHNGKNGVFINTQKTTTESITTNLGQEKNQNGHVTVKRPTKDKLAAPLYLREEIIGYLCIAKRRKQTGFRLSSIDQKRFFLLSQYIGRAIEMQQMRHLLASRYAPVALGRNASDHPNEHDGFSTNFIEAVKYPNKVAKIIAKSFYKDLRKAGFEPKQILVVASEIIENLNAAFRRTKAKTDESDS